ncbi:Y4yA family PLP-dependent enzyme [Luteococcus peritonei]|uniref:Y4yA family PLP-dependent enzyme n=1 Tax=Luteococcus peritonei TaxID=88874 RepID=A0ABW4RV16_9ACTN
MTVGMRGISPLTARREPWMDSLLADPDACAALLAEHGSPLNLVDTTPLAAHAGELHEQAARAGVPLLVQVARKANKALAVVDEAHRLGLGVDVGSERELRQVLGRGLPHDRLVLTAAVKPTRLLQLCLERDVLVALDNLDEAGELAALASERGVRARVALRICPAPGTGLPPSRFGLLPADWLAWLATTEAVDVAGVHFHLHGYAAADRVRMLEPALALVDALREAGHRADFIDIGGGLPMSYLDDAQQWEAFWQAHREALDAGHPITWRGHRLETVYPYHQSPVRGAWLAGLLASPCGTSTVAEEFVARGLELRCEPGRAMLDGCGMTLARVCFRKQASDGTHLVGLEMNRTQCRSTSDDFMVDPLLLRPGSAGEPSEPVEAYLVGAYCIEAELLTLRRMAFPEGVAVGDLVVFPNTGGYLMHILESASHQIPLARNLSRTAGRSGFELDPIDALPHLDT